MKTSNVNNGLKFNRTVISELNSDQMNAIVGGTNVHDHGGDGGSGCICNPSIQITKLA
ncbi:class I lanthipeptide [Aquimarina sp. U1-2]|uniref:class I lanthipeptide n=1 Tax=Aquimarina sp. U1-2 TaxID=2823141 RepID=UPI001AECB47B|nr:class I lanthipeptide [Aquimarina sp. U1-2]MBP2833387.1 class I lanthipeptide [Aquimarina sp. U1-2]